MLRSLLIGLFILLISLSLGAEVCYDVHFHGKLTKETVAILKSASRLVSLEEYPPATITALKRRADADLSNLSQGLQSLGYYRPNIEIAIDECNDPVQVNIMVDPGPIYRFACFDIVGLDDEEIDIRDLGVLIGKPALPKIIIDAEITLMDLVARLGYPLAEITSKEIIADECEATIHVTVNLDSGPLCYFGGVIIEGIECVEPATILNKLAWGEGQLYCPDLIMRTQNCLEATGLFTSITITPMDELDEEGLLPILIEVSEAYHHTIGFGASYNTDLGPGVTADWEDRNVRGLGEKLSMRTDIWWRSQRGIITFLQPDCLMTNQNLLWVAEVEHEDVISFTDSYFSLSGLFERRVNENVQISYGGTFKHLDATRSDNNGTFNLLKAPFSIRWSNANNLMDPTRGHSLSYKIVPTQELGYPSRFYLLQTLIGTTYLSLNEDKRLVLALKAQFGSIVGASDKTIPPPERLYAGTENCLRGYRYLSVSPLSAFGKPIGGRSLMVYSSELRFRVNDEFGGVVFYEIGNVYSYTLPTFFGKQLQSTGIGVRYNTPVGPLRMDIAFPLNPRRHIDNFCQVYFSIGQAF